MLAKRKGNGIPATRRYRGKLVVEAVDEMGLIEVVDDRQNRSLHFGSPEKQSAMSLRSHHELVLSYTQTMMAGLLFVDRPRSILNVGLGGGSVPKFLLHHYPDCSVDVVEIREKVVDLAYDYFHLPRDPRLNILICDVKEYFRTAKEKCYDIIVLDVFTKDGLSNSIKGFPFMNVCKSRLNENGILIMNLWSEPDRLYKKMVYNVYKCFKSQAMILPVVDRSNHIVIGINQPGRRYQEPVLRKKADILEKAFHISMPDLCSRLCELNQRLMTET